MQDDEAGEGVPERDRRSVPATGRLALPLLLGGAVLFAACGAEGPLEPPARPPDATAKPPPEPLPPLPVPRAGDPFAELPDQRTLDQHPPACCPGLLGGWQHPYIGAPGEEVKATLSSPGPDPKHPPRIDVNADVLFRVSRVNARGKRVRVVRERVVRVKAVQSLDLAPYLTVRLPPDAPAYYALEIELRPPGRPPERYGSYTYVPPQRVGVALLLDRNVAKPGQTLRLTIENRGSAPLEFGLAYRLERWVGRWKWLNREQVFILIAKGVMPGKRVREAIGLPRDLRPGWYRIAKSFTAQGVAKSVGVRGARRELDAAVQFRVR